MKRYLRTLLLFWNTSLAAEMEYRSNFLIASLSSLVNLVGSIFGLFLFYRVGHRLGGWTWEEALLVMGMFTLLDGFAAAFLQPNLGRLVQNVRDGTLDFVLLKPMDSQFWISTRNFSPWGLPNIIYGFVVIGYAGCKLGLSAAAYAAGLAPALMALAVSYGLWFMISSTSIWLVKIHNATYVLRNFIEAGRFPVSAFPSAYRFVLTFVLPVAFLTTVPAQAMLGQAQGRLLLCGAIISVLILLFTRAFWRFALRFYTSASS